VPKRHTPLWAVLLATIAQLPALERTCTEANSSPHGGSRSRTILAFSSSLRLVFNITLFASWTTSVECSPCSDAFQLSIQVHLHKRKCPTPPSVSLTTLCVTHKALLLVAVSVNCRHSGGCGKRQETMHSVVYTPGGCGKRQETMLCSVTTPKLIY
jgi:hypothetical protein